MTEIIFLGTAGDNYVVSKCSRNSGGIILKHNELQFHINPGPNALMMAKLNSINLRANTAVICTTSNWIYSNDVNAVIRAMTYEGMDVKGVLVGPKSLIEGDGKNQAVVQNSIKECVEKVIIAEKEKRIGIEDVDFLFTETSGDDDSLGIKIYFPDITIGYPGETAYSAKIAEQFEKCDILILNVQNPAAVKSKNALCTEDAIKFVKKIEPKLCMITGFGKDMLEQDPIMEARRIHSETGVQVIAASDGQKISPMSYSANSKQKSLKSF